MSESIEPNTESQAETPTPQVDPSLTAKINELQEIVEAKNDEIQALKTELNQKNEIIKDWEQKYQAQERRIEMLEGQLKETSEKLAHLENENNEKEKIIGELENKVKQLQTEMNEKDQRISELTKQVQEKENQMKQIQDELGRVKEELQKEKEAKIALDQALESFKQDAEREKAQLKEEVNNLQKETIKFKALAVHAQTYLRQSDEGRIIVFLASRGDKSVDFDLMAKELEISPALLRGKLRLLEDLGIVDYDDQNRQVKLKAVE